MMLDPPHTSAPMLMRGNALVLKTPVENAPRTSIEKHLSRSSDTPPAARFPPHRSRPAEYRPNRQPATVCAESGAGEARRRVGRRRGLLTSGARKSLRSLVTQSSAAPGAHPLCRNFSSPSCDTRPVLNTHRVKCHVACARSGCRQICIICQG